MAEESSQCRIGRSIVASSSAATPDVANSNSTPSELSPSIRKVAPRTAVSRDEDAPTYLTLVRYITRYLIEHEGIISKEAVALGAISTVGTAYEHVGRGATFEVYSTTISSTVVLERSCPRRLKLRSIGPSSVQPNQEIEASIICKRPLLRVPAPGQAPGASHTERIEAVILEVRALTHAPLFYHKNIVDFLGITWDSELAFYNPAEWEPEDSVRPILRVPVLLLERARYGSLAEFFGTKLFVNLGFESLASICRDVAEGLAVLHQCGIIHGDVKPDNILIFDVSDGGSDGSDTKCKFRAKIGDFGFSVPEFQSETLWSLTGGTWPWNDPDCRQPRPWDQLKKTDVFSYGLLAWTTLSKESIGKLFDVDLGSVARQHVEDLKDPALPSRAASYFRGQDTYEKLQLESVFKASLERRVESRGTMLDITDFWRTLFDNLGYKPYHPTPPDKQLKFSSISALRQSALRESFQTIARMSELLPASINRHLADVTDDPTTEGVWRGKVFRALCYLTGLGVGQDLNQGKDLIDEATFDCANSSIFQTMFLPREPSRRSEEEVAYAGLVCRMLQFAVLTTGSHEATQKLIQYFPDEGGYASRRCEYYRMWKYGILSPPATRELGHSALIAAQEADIESQLLHHPHIPSDIKHSKLHFAVAMGYFEATQTMLNSPGFDRSSLNLRDYNGDTPFLLAMRFGLFDITKLLISAGSDVNAQNWHGEAAFHFLVEFDRRTEKEEMTHLLFKLCNRSLSESSSTSSFPQEGIKLLSEGEGTPLNRIVFRNDILLANTFMKHQVDPATKRGLNALHLAAVCHSYDMLRIFWQAFPDLSAWTEDDMLADACLAFRPQRMYLHGLQTYDNMKESLNFLIDRRQASGAGPLSVRGVLLLHWALSRSVDKEIRLYLVSRSTKVEINTYSPSGDLSVTAVHIAIQSGSAEILEAVLDKGGNALMPIRNRRTGGSIDSIVACCGNPSSNNRMLQQFLNAHKEQSVPVPTRTLVMAVLNNNFSAAAMLIRAGVDINGVDEKNNTPLGNVIRRCTVDSLTQIRFLLEYPPTVDKAVAGFCCEAQIRKHGITPIGCHPRGHTDIRPRCSG